jgi:hypothetical protein
MHKIMKKVFISIQKVFLYLILVLVGLYAGMLFNHKICPVETQLNPIEYAKYWKIVDGTFMHERMAIMGPGMGIIFVLTILLFLKNWRSLTFLFLVLAFIAFAMDISFTLREQLPINAYINQLDLKTITAQQTQQLTEFQAKAIANFDKRFVHSTISFLLLCLTPFFLTSLNKKSK